jgi:peptide subunit release factor 1 (eRF1)
MIKIPLSTRSLKYYTESAKYGLVYFSENVNEPRHDKTNIVRLPPAWIQTSLRICAV